MNYDLMIKLTGWRRRGASRSARPSSQSLAPGTSCRSLHFAFKPDHSVHCTEDISMESVINPLTSENKGSFVLVRAKNCSLRV